MILRGGLDDLSIPLSISSKIAQKIPPREREGHNTMKTDRRNGSGKFFDDRAGSQGRDATYVRAAGKARLASKGSRRAQM